MERISEIAYQSKSLERFLHDVLKKEGKGLTNGVAFIKGTNKFLAYVYDKSRFIKTTIDIKEINQYPDKYTIDNKIIFFQILKTNLQK